MIQIYLLIHFDIEQLLEVFVKMGYVLSVGRYFFLFKKVKFKHINSNKKIFLGYLPTLEVSTWPSLQLEQRQHYTNLKRKYIEEPAEKMNKKGEEDLSDNNPLALSDSVTYLLFYYNIFHTDISV